MEEIGRHFNLKMKSTTKIFKAQEIKGKRNREKR